MAWYLRPVSGEYGAAERVDLDLADDVHPGSFEAEFEPADSGEQREDVRLVHAAPFCSV
jgi:hypothetical protein